MVGAVPGFATEENIALRFSRSFRGLQNHHLVTHKAYKLFATELDAIGWNQEHILNKKKLPSPFHGNHPAYSEYVIERIAMMKEQGVLNLENMTKLQFEMRQTVNKVYLETHVQRMNQYFKFLGY